MKLLDCQKTLLNKYKNVPKDALNAVFLLNKLCDCKICHYMDIDVYFINAFKTNEKNIDAVDKKTLASFLKKYNALSKIHNDYYFNKSMTKHSFKKYLLKNFGSDDDEEASINFADGVRKKCHQILKKYTL